MTVRSALREAIVQLTAAQVPSASLTAEVLLLHVLDRDRTFLYAHPEAELTLEQERAYRHLLSQRAAGTPTQYLTRQQEFWGLALAVEPGVFIPRPETEHVVEVALTIVRQRLRKPDARVVDVGTGTGAIALALASELPEAEIVATDISERALAVARANGEALGLTRPGQRAHPVRFLKSDLLAEFFSHHGPALSLSRLPRACPERSRGTKSRGEKSRGGVEGSVAAWFHNRAFDLVVSNPPYVGPDEAERLPREVREHEPAAALFSPEEGIALTRRLIEQAAVVLSCGGAAPADLSAQASAKAGASWQEGPARRGLPAQAGPQGEGGWLVLELSYNMAGRVRALLGDAWTKVEVTDDLRGIPRVLAAQKR